MLFFSIAFLIIGCGLPSVDDISVYPLEEPTISSIYNDEKSITINLIGYYPQKYLSDFEGFNLYIGDNNDPNEIKKRILYLESDTLPSKKDDPTTNENFEFTVEIKKKITYRFTSSATEQDLRDANAISKEYPIDKSYLDYEKYYFMIKAVKGGAEGPASKIGEHTVIKYERNLSINGGRLLGYDQFDLTFTYERSIPRNIQVNSSTTIQSVGYQKGLHHHREFPSKGYGNHLCEIEISYICYAKSGDEYLKIYIESTQPLKVSIGHKKPPIQTDINP